MGVLLCLSVRCFDKKIFGITDEEARYMDVQQKMVLEVSYKALEDAGLSLDKVKGTDTAVFMGMLCSDFVLPLDETIASRAVFVIVHG